MNRYINRIIYLTWKKCKIKYDWKYEMKESIQKQKNNIIKMH